ncbi:MAG TPA: ParB/RepB/Spo0J family partition protein [Armatimonadetes bacterium]|nr:ParB/RepB/Spo0J family partition protein [Armatimonadota bacterium]
MPKRTGLGRGLEALIPEAQEIAEGTPVQVSLAEIRPNPYQPRRLLDPQKLRELAASLAEHGLVQPVVVRPTESGYELIAGERRWRAAQQAGLETIPAVVRQCSDREMLEISLTENLQREDLNAIEAAEAYRLVLEKFNLTQEELARRLGKSRTAVANTLRLLNLEEEIREAIAEGRISEGHGRALLGISDPQRRREAFQRIEAEGLTVREVERLAQESTAQAPPRPRPRRKKPSDPHLQAVEEALMRALATKVTITPRGRGGTITIHYYSDEELDRLQETIVGRAGVGRGERGLS